MTQNAVHCIFFHFIRCHTNAAALFIQKISLINPCTRVLCMGFVIKHTDFILLFLCVKINFSVRSRLCCLVYSIEWSQLQLNSSSFVDCGNQVTFALFPQSIRRRFHGIGCFSRRMSVIPLKMGRAMFARMFVEKLQ